VAHGTTRTGNVTATSFDYLVGTQEERFRDRESDCFRALNTQIAKRVELLHEVVPKVTTLGWLVDANILGMS